MRTLSLFAVVAVAAFVAFAVPSRAEDSDADMVKAAEELDTKFLAAFNTGDVEAIAACYWNSPDLIVYPPAPMETHGHEATKQTFVEMIKEMKGVKLELTEKHNRVVGPAVLGWGRWTMTFEADGAPMQFEGRYTDLKEKKDGKWVYTMDHASSPMQPPK